MRQRNKLDGVCFWPYLAELGNLRIMQLTLFIPVIGYFILFNDALLNKATMFGASIVWKLQFIYFGSCFLGVGLVFFYIFCPRVIRSYSRPSDYVAGELNVVDGHAILKLCELSEDLCNKYTLQLDHYFTDNNLDYFKTNKSLNTNPAFSGPDIKQLLVGYFRIESRVRYKTRLAIFVLFAAGLVLVSVPTVYTFFEVFKYSINSIISNIR